MKRYVLIVTGDRYAKADQWEDVISERLKDFWSHAESVVVLYGECEGIDLLFANLALVHMPGAAIVSCPFIPGVGRKGGPLRNAAMIDTALALTRVGYIARCIAFHNDLAASKGTKDCTEQARAAGIKTILNRSNGSREVLS